MKINCLVLLVFITVISCDSLGASTFNSEELLVKYSTYTPHEIGNNNLEKIGWAKIKVNSGKDINKEMVILQANANIIKVEPNFHGEFLSIPNDPLFEDQWYLPNISLPSAWDISLGSGIIIGLIDSGVDLLHSDLTSNLLLDGWDFGDSDDDPYDGLGHGTAVCGILAAVQNNHLGISGTAPASMILPLKISPGTSDVFEAASVAEAIIYAADYGTKIINLSLGWSDEEPQVITDAISYAVNKGTLLIAAAGNVYGDPVYFPASHEDVIAVSATNQNDENVSSAFGFELDLVAPGSLMVTTARGGLYSYVSGTSVAAPLVSAVAALMSAINARLSAEQLKGYLLQTADDLGEEGKDVIYGYGKINAHKAVTAVTWCEGDFDCDTDVDGTDTATFKVDYGRSIYRNPCTAEHPCNGDFDCDNDCDGSDAALFKSDFGRSAYNNSCPVCEGETWCEYP